MTPSPPSSRDAEAIAAQVRVSLQDALEGRYIGNVAAGGLEQVREASEAQLRRVAERLDFSPDVITDVTARWYAGSQHILVTFKCPPEVATYLREIA